MQEIKPDPRQSTMNKKNVYEAPAIIYEGLLTTRAGTGPTGENPSGASEGAVDPADLFGDD